MSKLFHSPRRPFRPVFQLFCGPSRRLIRVARGARIGNFIFVGHRWSDKSKRVRSHLNICHCRLNLWHVAGNTTTARRTPLVMRVIFNGGGAWAIQGHGAVTIHAKLVGWFSQLSVILASMYVVTAKASHAATVHHALNESVSLHSILMRRAIRIVRESLLT